MEDLRRERKTAARENPEFELHLSGEISRSVSRARNPTIWPEFPPAVVGTHQYLPSGIRHLVSTTTI
jgi:hypothetical protein